MTRSRFSTNTLRFKVWQRYWLPLRRYVANWVPDSSEGSGFRFVGMNSGELELEMNVEGRTGSVFLSREMWYQMGAEAGWIEQEEADATWNEWVAKSKRRRKDDG